MKYDKKEAIKIFEEKKVRAVWDDETEEWYFSVIDIIAVLTDSSNPTDYFKKMRKRDEQSRLKQEKNVKLWLPTHRPSFV